MRSGKKAQSMLQVDVPLKGKWCPFAVGMALLEQFPIAYSLSVVVYITEKLLELWFNHKANLKDINLVNRHRFWPLTISYLEWNVQQIQIDHFPCTICIEIMF